MCIEAIDGTRIDAGHIDGGYAGEACLRFGKRRSMLPVLDEGMVA